MRRSKLEMYIDILRVLSRHGPLKSTHVMYKANINSSVLKDSLDFLIKQNLISEQFVNKRKNTRVVFAITDRGRTILKYFQEVTSVLLTTKEAKIPALLY